MHDFVPTRLEQTQQFGHGLGRSTAVAQIGIENLQRVLQLVALVDIGAFVAALIERRDQVFGKRFDLAGDELSGEEQAKILSLAIGRPIIYQEIPIAAARQQSEDVALMFEWFDRVGADADIAALRRDFSEVRWHSFADWAREFDWSVLERTSSVA